VDAHEHLTSLRTAHRRLLQVSAHLDDETVAGPSQLPGWNRAMLISHLRFGGEAQLRGVVAAANGSSAVMYPGGEKQRDAEIESGRNRSSAELHEELTDLCRRMEDTFAGLTDSQWNLDVVTRRGPIPVHEVLEQRWLDVEVHLVDLDVGQTIDDVSAELVDVYLPKLVAVLPALRRRPDADHGVNGTWQLVRSDGNGVWQICADGERAWLGDEAQQQPATTVTGSAKQLFGLLLGRLEPSALTCRDTCEAAKLKRAFPGP
jgi:maleylpyruvate isomerase